MISGPTFHFVSAQVASGVVNYHSGVSYSLLLLYNNDNHNNNNGSNNNARWANRVSASARVYVFFLCV